MKIRGTVVHGKHLGHTLGYPTANVQPDEPCAKLGKNGVYAAMIAVEGYPETMLCMVNQGSHPTVPEGPPTIEAHIVDFHGDIYGLRVELEPICFLRPEQRFPSLEALKAQLALDLERTVSACQSPR